MNTEPNREREALAEDEKPSASGNRFEEESRQAREATKRLKRRILVVTACLLVFSVIALLLIQVLDSIETQQRGVEKETMARPNTVIYFDPDYDYDIMKDQEYLGLDRYIYYKDARTNETIMLDEKTISGYGPAVITLKAMIDSIIAGDHEAYNALFSSNYFANPDNAPEEEFTMQQVYDILFTRVNVTECSSEEFGQYTQYEFTVEYKIHKNNGTFRTDLGHDDSRKQYFVLSDSATDEVLIDQILGYNYQS